MEPSYWATGVVLVAYLCYIISSGRSHIYLVLAYVSSFFVCHVLSTILHFTSDLSTHQPERILYSVCRYYPLVPTKIDTRSTVVRVPGSHVYNCIWYCLYHIGIIYLPNISFEFGVYTCISTLISYILSTLDIIFLVLIFLSLTKRPLLNRKIYILINS